MKFKSYNVANLFAVSVYVLYRSPRPDEETVNEVNRKMQELNVDTSHLVDLSADHCA
jgi:hypothetical protein